MNKSRNENGKSLDTCEQFKTKGTDTCPHEKFQKNSGFPKSPISLGIRQNSRKHEFSKIQKFPKILSISPTIFGNLENWSFLGILRE